MVVQVVVSDPNINRLDQAYGEPSVTVNGVRLRMAQATDVTGMDTLLIEIKLN